MQQPSIVFANFTIYEPVTSITDLLICVFCFIITLKLFKAKSNYWSLFYFFIALSALSGAFGHAFYAYKSNILNLYSRIMMVFAILFAINASVEILKHKKLKISVIITSIIMFVITVFLLLMKNDFEIVKWNNGIGIGIIVCGIHALNAIEKNTGSKIILVGVILILIAGIIHSLGISLSIWFTHNEIAHTISIIALFIIYKGILKSKENEEQKFEVFA